MKKIRYIPYGYTMRNGRTVISTEEAEIIREIFKAYLDGASLKAIAEELTGRQIPYTQRTTTWDKARIARIIDNAKYIGTEEYDPIIDEDMIFSAWKGLRMDNPFQLPEAHVRYKDGTTTARSDAKECGGNCTECARTSGGCWSLHTGEQVVFNEH